MAFCNKCGKQLSDQDLFCPGCGTKIAVESAPAPVPMSVDPPQVTPAPAYAPMPVSRPKAKRPGLQFPADSKMPFAAGLMALALLAWSVISAVMSNQLTYQYQNQSMYTKRFMIPLLIISYSGGLLLAVVTLFFAKKRPALIAIPLGWGIVQPLIYNAVSAQAGFQNLNGNATAFRSISMNYLSIMSTISSVVSTLLVIVAIVMLLLAVYGKLKSSKPLLIVFLVWAVWGLITSLILNYVGVASIQADQLIGLLFGLLSGALGYLPYILLVIGLKPAPATESAEEFYVPAQSAPSQPTQIPQPGQPYAPVSTEDNLTSGMKAACFFFPIVGFIIFATSHMQLPNKAKAALKAAIWGIVFWVVFSIVSSLLAAFIPALIVGIF